MTCKHNPWLAQKIRNCAYHAIYRCTRRDGPQWGDYGGRGISVHHTWLENPRLFIAYLLTLDGHDNPILMLDRIDNDGHYEPGNLRFVTREESAKNKRSPRIESPVTLDGVYHE